MENSRGKCGKAEPYSSKSRNWPCTSPTITTGASIRNNEGSDSKISFVLIISKRIVSSLMWGYIVRRTSQIVLSTVYLAPSPPQALQWCDQEPAFQKQRSLARLKEKIGKWSWSNLKNRHYVNLSFFILYVSVPSTHSRQLFWKQTARINDRIQVKNSTTRSFLSPRSFPASLPQPA